MVDAEKLYAAGTLPAACGECGWDNDGTLVIVDRYSTDYPPGPRGDGAAFIEAYRCEGGDPDDRIMECPDCGTQFDRDSMVERL